LRFRSELDPDMSMLLYLSLRIFIFYDADYSDSQLLDVPNCFHAVAKQTDCIVYFVVPPMDLMEHMIHSKYIGIDDNAFLRLISFDYWKVVELNNTLCPLVSTKGVLLKILQTSSFPTELSMYSFLDLDFYGYYCYFDVNGNNFLFFLIFVL
jgi:hypothetical protein